MAGLAVQPDIAYAASPLHSFDLYVPPQPHVSPPLICFVHGGAWRSEDKADHAPLARRLAAFTRCPVAVPNYRLTTPATPLHHPAHSEDVLRFLTFLLTWPGPAPGTPPPYDPSRLYLVSHSCSAHILTSIFLTPPDPAAAYPSLVPDPRLLASTRALVLSDGLYDFDLLLHTYPAYKTWFIAPAFGTRTSYAPFNTTTYAPREGAEHLSWLVLHSTGDTLVDMPQSERIHARLCELYPPRRVERNFDELTEEHNQMLQGELYPRLVGQFILDDIAVTAASTLYCMN
ncbi:alpha/beta-hydrolase [Amylocystis lapponica]|nr:alpha/beta-hydrolase [Amylocystis lapponica]